MKPRRQIVPHPLDAGLALVPLTRGHFAIISVVDAEMVAARNWHVTPRDHTSYAASVGPRPERRKVYLHQMIAQAAGMTIDGVVDHINGYGLDCRRSNLRPATHEQNAWNSAGHSASSGHKGVSWSKRRQSWRAVIMHRGRYIELGAFREKSDAIECVSHARARLHGESANHGNN